MDWDSLQDFPTPFRIIVDYPEEAKARQHAADGLRKVWVASKVPLYGVSSLADVDLDDLWARVRMALRGDGPPTRPPPTSDPFLVSALIRGGIVELLIQLLIDYAPYTKLIKSGDFKFSTWLNALEALGTLGKDIQKHPGAIFRRAEVEWNKSGLLLVQAFLSCPHLMDESPGVDEANLAFMRLMCLASLHPILVLEETSTIPSPSVPLARATLPCVVALRSRLAAGRTFHLSRQAGIVSADIICVCLEAIRKSIPDNKFDAEAITKVSYDELYDQAYASPGSGTDLPIESLDDSHVFARLHQFEIFGLIVGADDSEKSMKAVAKYRLITFSLGIKKAARGYWRFARDKNPTRHEDSFDWHDTMVLACSE